MSNRQLHLAGTGDLEVPGRPRASRVVAGLVLSAALAIVAATPGNAAKNDTELASIATVAVGGKANRGPSTHSVSRDGRYVAFATQAANLVPEDTDDDEDVYVRDTVAGTTTLISPGDGDPSVPGSRGSGSRPSISDDGRRVAFLSYRGAIDPNDGNGDTDVYVYDFGESAGQVPTVDGDETTTLASRPSGTGAAAPAPSEGVEFLPPEISGNGNAVAFLSNDNALDPARDNDGGSGAANRDVFVRDLTTDTTELVSRDGATDANDATYSPSIDFDGSHVGFETQADNLPGDMNADRDIFVHDRGDGSLTLVNRDDSGAKSNAEAFEPELSDSGEEIAFVTFATGLDDQGADTDGFLDIYLRDVSAGTTELISRASGASGAKADGAHSQAPSISGDGRRVAFLSKAANLEPGSGAPGDPADNHIYIRDRAADTTQLESRTAGIDGELINNDAIAPAISANGNNVAFSTRATNLDPSDDDAIGDAYIRNVVSGEVELVTQAPPADPVNGNGESQDASISADGSLVAFTSAADNLHPEATNGRSHVFVRDLASGETIFVSRATGADGEQGEFTSRNPSISADGRYVAFESESDNLGGNDGVSHNSDIYLRDLQAGTTQLVSYSDGDANIAAEAYDPDISADGQRISFASDSGDYHSQAGPTSHVYVRDRGSQDTLLATRPNGPPSGVATNGPAFGSAISDDGSAVAFNSVATNLVAGSQSGSQAYVRRLDANRTELASRASGNSGAVANDSVVGPPSISADGARVAFSTDATNLHPDDASSNVDVFVRDTEANQTLLASRASNGDRANRGASSANSQDAAISGDGTFVAFQSDGTNLDPGATDGNSDVFHRDLVTGTTTLASRRDGANGAEGNNGATEPVISEHGRFVAFDTGSTNLDAADNDTSEDVYRRDVLGPDNVAPNTTINSGPANGTVAQRRSYQFTFTADEPGSTLECRLQGATAYAECDSPFNTGNLADGTYTFQVRGTDRPGNVETSPASRTFTVDNAAPQTQISSGPSGTINESSATFRFGANGNPAGFTCSLDGGPATACSSPRTFGGLGEGRHTVSIRAFDAAGNVEATPAARAFTVDTGIEGRKIKIPKKQRQRRKVVVKATLKPGEAGKGVLSGKVKVGNKKYKLKRSSRQAKSGQKAVLKAKVKGKKSERKVKRALKKGKKVVAPVTVKFTDPAGNVSKARKSVKLK